MKLFYGGFGDYTSFTAAETEVEAIENIKKQPGMGWLPVEAHAIAAVDGYNIELVDPTAILLPPIQEDKQEVKPDVGIVKPDRPKPAKPAGKPKTAGKSNSKRK